MGSAVSLLAGLGMTGIVFVLLPEFHERLNVEQRPLLVALAWSLALALAAAAAFVGEIRARSWRRVAQLLLVVVLVGMCWHYWPV